MNPVDVMNHTLSALLDSQKPKRPDPPYDKTMRVEVTVEIDVPVWLTVDENGPDVTLSPVSDWKLAPMDEKARLYVENAIEEMVEDDWREAEEAAFEAHECAKHDRGDWLYEQRKDRES